MVLVRQDFYPELLLGVDVVGPGDHDDIGIAGEAYGKYRQPGGADDAADFVASGCAVGEAGPQMGGDVGLRYEDDGGHYGVH